MTEIIKILENTEGLSGYKINGTKTVSYELFFVHRSLETVRSTDTSSKLVTVYVNHDGKVGDSSFSVYNSMGAKEIEESVKKAVARAKLVSNEPYELVPGEKLEASVPTNLDSYAPEELGRMIADAVYAADTVPGGSINALEIFITRSTSRVVNSRGVDKTQTVHHVMIEAIPTFTDEKQSVEIYEDYRFAEFDAEKITAEIAEKMREVADRAKAVKPGEGFTADVLLRPLESMELVWSLAEDCDYATIYQRANLHKEGDNLQEGDGDKLNVTVKGIIDGSVSSSYFDGDGSSLTDTAIIKDGVLCGTFGSSRFGQYLGVEKPSGVLGCIKVEPGTLTGEQLASAPYLECVSMSGIQIEPYSDYIGGEIRLAYLHKDGKTVPLTGISMSGKLSEVLATLRLHEKTCVYNAYEGPVSLLLKNMEIL